MAAFHIVSRSILYAYLRSVRAKLQNEKPLNMCKLSLYIIASIIIGVFCSIWVFFLTLTLFMIAYKSMKLISNISASFGVRREALRTEVYGHWNWATDTEWKIIYYNMSKWIKSSHGLGCVVCYLSGQSCTKLIFVVSYFLLCKATQIR